MRKFINGAGVDSTALVQTYLAGNKQLYTANLYVISTAPCYTGEYLGQTFLITDYASPLLWSHKGTFQPGNILRGQIQSRIGLEASTVDVTWSDVNSRVLASSGGTTLLTVLQGFYKQVFDNGNLEIWKCLMPTPGDCNTFGACMMFSGRIGNLEHDRAGVKVTVLSRMETLNVQVPTNLIEPGNIAAEYSVGVLLPDGPTSFTILAGSTASKLYAEATLALPPTNLTTSGPVTAYYWGDSPHSGDVAEYIWKNPTDGGTGTNRAISTATGSVSGNSWVLDSNPENGSVPILWTTMNTSGSPSGAITLFSPAMEIEGYQDFNVCLVGWLSIPAAGTYTFSLTNKDQVMVGIGGGTIAGGYVTGARGQTMSVVNALPLVLVSAPDGSGGAVTSTVNVTYAAAGLYPIELNWDYWYHTGRCLILTASPTPGASPSAIPPVPNFVLANNLYNKGYIVINSGAQLGGSYRRISRQTIESGDFAFYLDQPLPFPPTPGDTFNAYIPVATGYSLEPLNMVYPPVQPVPDGTDWSWGQNGSILTGIPVTDGPGGERTFSFLYHTLLFPGIYGDVYQRSSGGAVDTGWNDNWPIVAPDGVVSFPGRGYTKPVQNEPGIGQTAGNTGFPYVPVPFNSAVIL